MSRTRPSICFLLPSHWSTFTGGAEYQAKLLIDRLVETTDYRLYYMGRRVKPDPNSPYELINIGSPFWFKSYSKVADIPHILRALRRVKPDLIYQRVAGPYTGAAAYYAKHSGCKLIWHIAHDTDVLDGPNDNRRLLKNVSRRLDRKLIEYGMVRADAIFAQTQHQADLLKKVSDREVTDVIPNFHPPVSSADRMGTFGRVVWVANIRAFKGPEAFLRLAATIGAESGFEFLMIGRDESGGDFQRDIERHGASEVVKYIGEQTQEEVNRLLEQSDILVNTSVHEGFPNTFIQAWLRGTVVVSLSIDPDGIMTKRGMGVCCQTEAELAATVRRLLASETKRAEISRRARNYAMETHSLQNADKLIDQMRSLL